MVRDAVEEVWREEEQKWGEESSEFFGSSTE
jgi:hypothetical protein